MAKHPSETNNNFEFFYVKSIIFLIKIEPRHVISNNVDSDEPVQPPFKLRNSKCYSVCSLTVIEYSSD